MSVKQKGHDYSRLLLIGSFLVVAIRYAGAFVASDVGAIEGISSIVTTAFMAVSGIGMGFLVVFGQSYTFDGWKRSLPKPGHRITWRCVLLTLIVVLLIIVDVAILVPFTVSRIRHESISIVLGEWDWLWSVSVNIAPALLLAGVGLGNQVVSVTQTEITQKGRNITGNLPRKVSADWRQVRKELSREDVTWLLTARTEEICFRFGIEDRTARNWRRNAQKESEK